MIERRIKAIRGEELKLSQCSHKEMKTLKEAQTLRCDNRHKMIQEFQIVYDLDSHHLLMTDEKAKMFRDICQRALRHPESTLANMQEFFEVYEYEYNTVLFIIPLSCANVCLNQTTTKRLSPPTVEERWRVGGKAELTERFWEKPQREGHIIYINMYNPFFSWVFLILTLSIPESDGQSALETGEVQGRCSQGTCGRRQG